MIAYNLDSIESANKLVRVCDAHRDATEIDVNYGRCTVDGSSILGVYSLIGHYVTVEPLTDDKSVIDAIRGDLEK